MLLQQFALSPWDSDPERLINSSSAFDSLWVFECYFWRRKGVNTPTWNVQTQDIARTGNQRTIQYAFLSLTVTQINMLVPGFSSSVVIRTTITKIRIAGKGRLKRHLSIRYLKEKFTKTDKNAKQQNHGAAWHIILIMLFS